jgi:glutathione S-transferase
MSDEQHRDFVDQLPLRKHFYRAMGRTGFSKEEVDAALERLRQTVERMEKSLGKTLWLANDSFTLADISIMPAIVRMEDLGLSHIWSDLPLVQSWYMRLQQRPPFSMTYPAGSRDIHPNC